MSHIGKTAPHRIKLAKGYHPEDGISPRLLLASAAAQMIHALDWMDMNGYQPDSDENEITVAGLTYTISRMLAEVDTLRDMALKLDAQRRDQNAGASR